MRSFAVTLMVLSGLTVGPGLRAGTEQAGDRLAVDRQGEKQDVLVVVGRVRQVDPPRLLMVENRLAEHRELLVLLPEGSSMPAAGTLVHARGVLRRVDKADVGTRAWSALEQRAQEGYAGRPILVADSLAPAPEPAMDADRPALPVAVQSASRREITVRPAALANLIGELAGFQVRVPYARIVGLFDSRAFLIDSAIGQPAPLGYRDRVLVLVDAASLRLPAESLVASTVTVEGVARTILGVQTTGEVPWPAKLDRDALKRLEVRAAVLATSVRTAEGVELTGR